jgi:hypothetical protein
MICLYFPVRKSSAMMSRIKSEGLSVSVVIGTSKLSAKAQIDNFRGRGGLGSAFATRC